MLILHCKSTYFQFAYFIILQANKYHLRQVIESELQRSSLAKTQPNNNPRKIRSLNTDFLPRKHPPYSSCVMCPYFKHKYNVYSSTNKMDTISREIMIEEYDASFQTNCEETLSRACSSA
jgi:hypothetical protein